MIDVATQHVAAAWGKSSIDKKIYYDLIPNLLAWDAPSWDAPAGVEVYLTLSLKDPDFYGLNWPSPSLSGRELFDWWSYTLDVDELPFDFATVARIMPPLLFFVAVHLLRTELYVQSEQSPFFECALSMAGAGAVCVVNAVSCSLCNFRLAVHGSVRCAQCTLSKRFMESDSVRSQSSKVRRTKRILAEAQGIEGVAARFDARVVRSLARLAYTFKEDSSVRQAWLSDVKEALQYAPHVSCQLPPDFLSFNHNLQLTWLQKVIDPQEWDYLAWKDKIKLAERWFAAQTRIEARRRNTGFTKRTIELADEARRHLKDGKSKSKVAELLGITRSHLSHVMKRTADRDERH